MRADSDQRQRLPRHPGRSAGRRLTPAAAALACLALAAAGASPALADLKICNATASRVGVAIGYQDKDGWASEGWWNIPSQTCDTLLKGAVPSRFIYVYAVDYDRGGEWTGDNALCIADRAFATRHVKNCEQQGLKPARFFEVDTGESGDWTVRLADTGHSSGANAK